MDSFINRYIMKKFLLCFFIFLPFFSFAQNLNGRFSSSFYTFQRFDNLQKSELFVRNTEALFLNLNYEKFSLRTRMNFETMIGKALDNDPRLRFYNLFLEGRDVLDIFTVRIGRQPLFTPISGGLFDGINIKATYSDYSLTAFYGGNLPAFQKFEFLKDIEDNFVMGARFDATPIENLNLAISYFDKNFKPMDYETLRLDDDLDPVRILIMQKSNQFKFLSGSVNYEMPGVFDIYSSYEYDLNYRQQSKIEANGKVWITDNIGINGYYNWREPKIRYNSIFSIFNFGHTQEYEGGIDYKINSDYTVFGKFGYVEFQDENSSRLTLGATTKFGSVSYRKNLGYAGELDNISVYAAKSFLKGLITPSIGVAYTTYKLSKDAEENNITSLLGGVNYRPWKTWSFDLQGQFFNNKIYNNDFRVLLKINHWFNTNF